MLSYLRTRVLLAVLFALITPVLWSSSAHAIATISNFNVSNISPHPAGSYKSSAGLNTLDATKHELLITDHGNVPRVDLGLYFPDNAGTDCAITTNTWNCKTINIRHVPGNGGGFCYAAAGRYSGDTYALSNNYVKVVFSNYPIGNDLKDPAIAGFQKVTYTIDGDDLCSAGNNQVGLATQSSARFYGTYEIPTWLPRMDAETGKYKAYMTLRFVSNLAGAGQPIGNNTYETGKNNLIYNYFRGADTAMAGNPNGIEFNFMVHAGAGVMVGGLFAGNRTNNSIQGKVEGLGGNISQHMPFGLSCIDVPVSGKTPSNRVTLYDADNYGSWGNWSQLKFFVGKITGPSTYTPLTAAEYVQKTGGGIDIEDSGTTYPIGGYDGKSWVDNSQGYPRFVPGSFNNQGGATSVWIKDMLPPAAGTLNGKYVLVIHGINSDGAAGPSNFIYLGVPGDQIFGSHNFQCPPPPPATITANTSFNATEAEVGSSVTANAWFVNSSANPGSVTATWSTWYGAAADGFGAGDVRIGADKTVTAQALAANGGRYDFPATVVNPVLDTAGYNYICTQIVSYSSPMGSTIVGAGLSPRCIPIVKSPYFSVWYGDINAAAKLEGGAGSPSIYAFNKENNPAYTGAGTQIAAYATGTIQGFVSSILNTSLNPRPKALTFANTGAAGTPPASVWGGGFSSNNYVIGDYWAGTSPVNVYIDASNANSTYTNTSLENINLPWIIADNIYISSGVTEVNAILVAKNMIYTCASGNSAPYSINQMAANCRNTLTINGAVIAGGGVKLQRTGGSLNGAPAERFNYTPEVWLQSLATPTGLPPVTDGSGQFNSITVLPPVL